MSWNKLAPAQAQKKSQVTVTLSLTKSGKGTIILGVPSAVAGMTGFDKAETASVMMGADADAGKLLVQPKGEFSITRLKGSVVVRFPAPEGVRLRPAKAQVPYEKAGPQNEKDVAKCGFIITLPGFLMPQNRVAAGPKPGSLRMNGVILEMGAKAISFTKAEAVIMSRLLEDWGKCVRKEVLHDELYALDSEGGAEPKIVDIWVHKIRKKLREKAFDLLIETHWGTGYELRRASE